MIVSKVIVTLMPTKDSIPHLIIIFFLKNTHHVFLFTQAHLLWVVKLQQLHNDIEKWDFMRVSRISTLIIQCTDNLYLHAIPRTREALNLQGFTCSLLTIKLPHNSVPNESKSSQSVVCLKEDTYLY